MRLQFEKMHGLGNDFVVLDGCQQRLSLTKVQIQALSHRRTGIGCDQLVIMEPSENADVFLRFYNASGEEIDACGNATRCVAAKLMDKKTVLRLETNAGLLTATRQGDHIVVDMGLAKYDWRDIPLREACDTLRLPLEHEPTAVSIGNPHAVFFVENVEEIPLSEFGPLMENNPLFPQKANIEIVQVLSPTHLRMRVWERDVGITLACGTGACAALVAASRRNLTERRVTVTLDGGDLTVEWLNNGHVTLCGETALSFSGTVVL